MFRLAIHRLVDEITFAFIYLRGRILGISTVVTYLRNPNPRISPRLLLVFGATVGERTRFKRSIFIDNSFEDQNSSGDFRNLIIGKNCYIGDCVYFDLANQIILEDNVVISGQVSFLTHADCNRSAYLEEIFPRVCSTIRVGHDAWLGFGAIVQAGVTIGSQAVLASGSMLRANVEPNSVFAGVPAKKIRDLPTGGLPTQPVGTQ